MKNEIKRIALKSAKLAGVTCVAAGAIAFVASGAAVKAVAAGGKYLKETVKKILEEEAAPCEKEETLEQPVEEVQAASEEEAEEVKEAAEAAEAAAQEATPSL